MDMSADMVKKWRESENGTGDGPETHFVIGDEEFLPIKARWFHFLGWFQFMYCIVIPKCTNPTTTLLRLHYTCQSTASSTQVICVVDWPRLSFLIKPRWAFGEFDLKNWNMKKKSILSFSSWAFNFSLPTFLIDQSIHDTWEKLLHAYMVFILMSEWVSCRVTSINIDTQTDLAAFTH